MNLLIGCCRKRHGPPAGEAVVCALCWQVCVELNPATGHSTLSGHNCAPTGSVQQRAAQGDAHELVLPTGPFLSAALCTASFLMSSQIRSKCLASKVRLQMNAAGQAVICCNVCRAMYK